MDLTRRMNRIRLAIAITLTIWLASLIFPYSDWKYFDRSGKNAVYANAGYYPVWQAQAHDSTEKRIRYDVICLQLIAAPIAVLLSLFVRRLLKQEAQGHTVAGVVPMSAPCLSADVDEPETPPSFIPDEPHRLPAQQPSSPQQIPAVSVDETEELETNPWRVIGVVVGFAAWAIIAFVVIVLATL